MPRAYPQHGPRATFKGEHAKRRSERIGAQAQPRGASVRRGQRVYFLGPSSLASAQEAACSRCWVWTAACRVGVATTV